MNTPPSRQEFSPPSIAVPGRNLSTADKSPRVHLGFIDSLRALAALYVAACHVFGQLHVYEAALASTHPQLGKLFTFIGVALFRHGHLAVAVFIVISGFCLMLPLARHDKVQMEGAASFIARRARRILPPYYAALAVTLLLMLVIPGMNQVTGGNWLSALPAFDASTIVSHLLLFHHWSDQWILKINPPLWSIGVEWQIYFLMPWFFLPALRRLGRIKMLILTSMLGIALTYAGLGWLPKLQTFVHFIALFAAGMVTAQLCLSTSPTNHRLRQSLPSSTTALVLLVLIVALLALQTRQSLNTLPFIRFLAAISWNHVWVMDYLVTASFCSLLISLCQENQSRPIRLISKTLHWVPLVFIGHFSYSIYLIHDPSLRLLCTIGEHLRFSPLTQHLVLFSVGVPFAVFCGYLLFLAVERHFIRTLPTHSK